MSDKGKHLMQPIDITSSWELGSGKLTYTRAHQDPEEECFVRMPFEVPCYMRVVRILNGEATVPKHGSGGYESLGSTVELTYTGMGVIVYVRYGRDGTLRVFARDADGLQKLGEWYR